MRVACRRGQPDQHDAHAGPAQVRRSTEQPLHPQGRVHHPDKRAQRRVARAPKRRGHDVAVPQRADVLQRHQAQGMDAEGGGHDQRDRHTQRGERAVLGGGVAMGVAAREGVRLPEARQVPRPAEGLLPQGQVPQLPGVQAAVRQARLGGGQVRHRRPVRHRLLQRQERGPEEPDRHAPRHETRAGLCRGRDGPAVRAGGVDVVGGVDGHRQRRGRRENVTS